MHLCHGFRACPAVELSNLVATKMTIQVWSTKSVQEGKPFTALPFRLGLVPVSSFDSKSKGDLELDQITIWNCLLSFWSEDAAADDGAYLPCI